MSGEYTLGVCLGEMPGAVYIFTCSKNVFLRGEKYTFKGSR